jgi:hypothetical protein
MLHEAADELEALVAVNKWRGDKLEQYAQEIEHLTLERDTNAEQAVQMARELSKCERERDEVLAKIHDGTLWQPAYMLLMEERDRLQRERNECASALTRALSLLNDALESKTALRAALRDLLEDTQHSNHDCGDDASICPVVRARETLGKSKP